MNSASRHRQFPIRANGAAMVFRRLSHAATPWIEQDDVLCLAR
jgi:hypothetical protein